MPAPKGNNYKMKWKTKKERKAAFEVVCIHLKKGLSKECFPLADWDTVERYIKDFPEDFPTEKINEAMRMGQMEWELIGMNGAKGEIQGFNAASWIFNMKNRYKDNFRDKIDYDVEFSGDINITLGGNVDD
jgi:hypothetical protein